VTTFGRRLASRLYLRLATACAFTAIVITIGIALVLVSQSALFFHQTSVKQFLFSSVWSPGGANGRYGVWPLFGGSVEIMLGSALLAVPLGTLNAIFISEYAPQKWRAVSGIPLDLMAGIPSVVYGYLGIFLVTPWLRSMIPSIQDSNAASASIVVALMILPLVSALIREALLSTQESLRDAAYALGLTKAEVVYGVILPNSAPSIFAAFFLAMARAIGETMAIALAAGSTPNPSLNPLKSTETITAYILTTSGGDVSSSSTRYLSIFALGLLLFVATYSAGILANRYRPTRLGARR
jgi:phosphate transport system permease protein